MNRKFLLKSRYFVFLGILVFLAFISIPYLDISKKNNLETFSILMDEHGFTPNKLNIKSGTKVIFKNIGTLDHWPAGDDHPSHTLYDGTNLGEHCNLDVPQKSFDSCVGIKPGEFWAFVFDKTGTYGFHDHLWSHLGGEITVEGFNNIRQSNATKHEDLKHQLESIVVNSDPRQAIRELRDLSSLDEEVLRECHVYLHVIGHTAFQKYGSFKEAIKYQEDFCNSGYVHGLFEEYFKSSPNGGLDLSKECRDYAKDKREFDLWQCNHGIGHGLMYKTGGDIDETLELCSQNLFSRKEIKYCQNGAYMELFNAEILAKERELVDPANPLETCKKRSIAKGDCYIYIPSYFFQNLNTKFENIFKECKRAELGYEEDCLRGVGTEVMKNNMLDSVAVFDLCSQAGSYGKQEACVSGAVGEYINQEGLISGQDLCESIKKKFRNTCLKEVKRKEIFFK